MKYLLIILLFVSNYTTAQRCTNNNNVFFTAGSGVFCGKELQFNVGAGKYFSGSYSAATVEYQFIKEHYTIIPIKYSRSHTLEFSYLYSFRFCAPLYLNVGCSLLAGAEKTFDRRVFMYAGRVFAQSEAHICKFLSFYFEPAITYRFTGAVKSKTNITASAGIKIYLKQ